MLYINLRKSFFIFLRFRKIFRRNVFLAAGRNFLGRICVYHQGSGDKHNFLIIDRFRNLNLYGFVLRIIDDFFRSSFIGLIMYFNGLLSFIILSEGIVKNAIIFSGIYWKNYLPLGSTQKLLNIKLFDCVNSLEKFPGGGAVLARAAGACVKIMSKDREKALIKLNSGWQFKIAIKSLASLGIASNISYSFVSLQKAGLKRAWGVRPTVRGVIKNSCDHPHGGGEGKGSPPVAQVSPWGWLCKGTPSKNRKIDKYKRKIFKVL